MNLKRAIVFGAIFWLLIFFEISVLIIRFNMQNAAASLPHYLFLGIITLLITYAYTRDTSLKISWEEGTLAGISFVAVGLILDALITVPLFVKDYTYFVSLPLWLGVIEVIVLATIIGAFKK